MEIEHKTLLEMLYKIHSEVLYGDNRKSVKRGEAFALNAVQNIIRRMGKPNMFAINTPACTEMDEEYQKYDSGNVYVFYVYVTIVVAKPIPCCSKLSRPL